MGNTADSGSVVRGSSPCPAASFALCRLERTYLFPVLRPTGLGQRRSRVALRSALAVEPHYHAVRVPAYVPDEVAVLDPELPARHAPAASPLPPDPKDG